MPTALVQGRIAVQYSDLLKKYLTDDWDVLVWDPAKNDPSEFPAMAAKADCMVGGSIPSKQWPAIPNLKLFQIPWTGYDFCSPQTMPENVPVCNCFEHESAIAEYVLGGMLEMSLGLRKLDKDFRSGGWNGKNPGENTAHGELRDATVGIIGYGHIGYEVAKRANAFGMRVIGTRRSQQETPEYLDWLGTPDKMGQLLSESDFIVVDCGRTICPNEIRCGDHQRRTWPGDKRISSVCSAQIKTHRRCCFGCMVHLQHTWKT